MSAFLNEIQRPGGGKTPTAHAGVPRRASLAFGFKGLLTGLLLSLSLASPGKAELPNVVYILADDLGYGDVGFLGQEKILTPALDRMAGEGLVFTRHYAGAAVCGPSRACLLTGMSQAVGYIKNNPGDLWQRENLRDRDITIAEKLKEAGYTTACFGKWGLGPQGKSGYPLNQGFDEFVGYDTHRAAHNYYPKQLCANEGKLPLVQTEEKRTYSHDVFTGRALDFLKRPHEQPFFLYLAYTIPHGPFDPPDLGPYADQDWTGLQKRYAAMVTRMDRDIGRVLQVLRDRGLDQDTLVIFSSDNGPQSSYGEGANHLTRFFDSNGPLRGIKRDLFDGGIMVPTVFWWPGTVAPGTTGHVSGFQDIMPTLCELAGQQAPEGIDGLSLVPILTGRPEEQKQHDYLYWEFLLMKKSGSGGGRQALLDVARKRKVIRYGRHGEPLFFDLEADPGERDNKAAAHPEEAKELNEKIDTVRGASELWPIEMHETGWFPQR